MQGTHIFDPHAETVIVLESFVADDHILRKIDSLLDMAFVRELTVSCYASGLGRPSIDPEVFFRMELLAFLYGIKSERRLCEEIRYNIAYRWFCHLSLEDDVPDHSSLSRTRDRYSPRLHKHASALVITQGYLCPLVTKAGAKKPDTSGLHVRYGEFMAGEVEDLMDQDELVDAACREIVTQTRDRNACLIFAAGVAHAKHVQSVLQEKYGVECGLVIGDTPPGEREETLARFRGEKVPADLFGDPKPPLKYLVNVDVLTTGYDSPSIDVVSLLRPTMSAGLLIQMVTKGPKRCQSSDQ